VRLRWAEPLAVTLAFTLVRLLARTWRYREHGREHPQRLHDGRQAFIFVLWHNRILPLLFLHRNEAMVLLISRHRDGGLLASLAERWGYRFVRGSSQRGGEVGLLGVVRALQSGSVVALTPDGPRGPAEHVKPGVVAAAQHAEVPVVPASAHPSRAWWLRTWDRFCIPKPFARIDVYYGPAIRVGPGKDGLRTGIDAVERALAGVTRA
jgi:lysophospholipid acyltransferase (LPLAT)-like uncharacterized protein